MIKAIIWDYDGTLVDTHIKNLNVTRKIIEHITGKKPENIQSMNTRDLNTAALHHHHHF